MRIHTLRRATLALLAGVALILSARLSTGQSAAGRPATADARTWIGRSQEIEEYLRTAECVRMEDLPGSPASGKRCVLRPGGPVARMSWRMLLAGPYRGFKESYKTEIAAYELDKLLKMDMVPPTVEREWQGYKGAAVQWVENVNTWQAGTSPGEADVHWQEQLVRMRMFDDLIGNKDRNRLNVLHDASWNLILIDHSRSFGAETALSSKLTRVDKGLWAKIERLSRPQLDAALKPWLDADQIAAILTRRDKMALEISSQAR